MSSHPVLYSYRRCPYAMRARMGICLAGKQVEQREIVFWDKPQPMLEASPKGTVPVLILNNGTVIDESRDVLSWALNTGEYAEQFYPQDKLDLINQWIDRNDDEFKNWLDRYKYADRHPDEPAEVYRLQGEKFLALAEESLQHSRYLLGAELTAADIAIFPFIRQFVNVDKQWWQSADYPQLKSWLDGLLSSECFVAIMKNRPVWLNGHEPLWVLEPDLKTKDEFRKKAEKQQ